MRACSRLNHMAEKEKPESEDSEEKGAWRPAALAIDWANEETTARIEWVKEQLGFKCLQPLLPPHQWSGKAELVNMAMDQWKGMQTLDAVNLIDAAVVQLAAHDRPDDRPIQRQLAFLRLRFIWKLATEPNREEMQYKYDKVENPATGQVTIQKVPFKSKTIPFDAGAMLQIAQAIEDLQGLRDDVSGVTNNVLVQIREAYNDQTKDGKLLSIPNKKTGSMAQAAKAKSIKELLGDPDAQTRALLAMDTSGVKVKRTNGRPKKGSERPKKAPKPEPEDEDED